MSKNKIIIGVGLVSFVVILFVQYIHINRLVKLEGQLEEEVAFLSETMRELSTVNYEDKLFFNEHFQISQATIDALNEAVETLTEEKETQNLEYQQEIQQLTETIKALEPPRYVYDALAVKGIMDYTEIEEDLREKGNEVIGFEGVLGGTMQFREIRLLNDKWVFADFDDGHIGGAGIYAYEITEDKQILWTVVEEFLY